MCEPKMSFGGSGSMKSPIGDYSCSYFYFGFTKGQTKVKIAAMSQAQALNNLSVPYSSFIIGRLNALRTSPIFLSTFLCSYKEVCLLLRKSETE